MARRRRRSRSASSELDREVLQPSSLTVRLVPALPRQAWRDIEDRRTWWPDEPEVFRPTMNTYGGADGGPPRVTPKNKNRAMMAHSLKFPSDDILICQRRKARREVLFAKKKTRKGAGSRKRRNFFSNFGC